jgi:hypothetical protein
VAPEQPEAMEKLKEVAALLVTDLVDGDGGTTAFDEVVTVTF